MQSSQEIFCEECGAANSGDATHCFACNELLAHSPASLPAPVPVVPVKVAPLPNLQVTVAAALAAPDLATAAEDALKPGTLMQGRYRIHSEIGRGGYSVVYKALDTAHRNNMVSIKQINLRNLTSRQAIEATETFNRETTLLPILRHNGIPRFYGHFTDPEHWYLVMEYVPGQTLEDYLQSPATTGYYSLSETLKIGIALSSVLEYLHLCKPPLIFRDVKPANVMLTPHNKLYLIDFGIARSFNPSKSKDTTPLGSPGFAAPEQYGRGQSDARTDIYGLGATLQTLLTGRDPLELRAGEPPRSSHSIPQHIQNLLDEMMDSDPTRRPRNMTMVKQRLQNALARVQWRFSYTLGLGLGLVLFLWGDFNTHTFSVIGSYGNPLNGLVLASLCLWVLSLVGAAITFFVFLFSPSRRFISLGASTILLLSIVLSLLHILTF